MRCSMQSVNRSLSVLAIVWAVAALLFMQGYR
jgi:hypothetical protein